MLDYLKRSDVDLRQMSSEKNHENNRMEGYEPSDYEQEEKRPRERMRLENSYGKLTLGMSEDGAFVFSVSEKRKSGNGPVTADETKVMGSRMSEKEDGVFMNSHDASKSAEVYKEDLSTRYHQLEMLERMKKSALDEGTAAVLEKMPFLTVSDDKARLRQLHEVKRLGFGLKARAGAGMSMLAHLTAGAASDQISMQSGMKSGMQTELQQQELRRHQMKQAEMQQSELQQQEDSLTWEIQQKERMRRQVLKSLSAAVQKAPEAKETSSFPWLRWLAVAAEIALNADDNAGDEDDETEENSEEGSKSESSEVTLNAGTDDNSEVTPDGGTAGSSEGASDSVTAGNSEDTPKDATAESVEASPAEKI